MASESPHTRLQTINRVRFFKVVFDYLKDMTGKEYKGNEIKGRNRPQKLYLIDTKLFQFSFSCESFRMRMISFQSDPFRSPTSLGLVIA